MQPLLSGYRFNVGLAFGEMVRNHGERPAIKFSDTTLTYSELDVLSNKMAALFIRRGLARRDVVAVVHTKAASCYAAMLGALKLGVAYVNLDEQNPAARLHHILSSSRPRLLVGEQLPEGACEAARNLGIPLLDLAAGQDRAALESADGTSRAGMPLVLGSDPAYVMYTSGSTGVPKGAIMTHANVLNFAAWAGARIEIGPTDVLSNVNPMYFDNSVFDFYAALLNGASIAAVSRENVADPGGMLSQLERAGCTVWFSVPSMLIYLTTLKVLDGRRLGSVRAFVFGGEGYPKPELRKLFGFFGARSKLVNVYGPTECACICSAWDVQSADLEDPNGFVTLGPVADNFGSLVLDDEDRAVDPGGVGELCLLGPQVGLGYVNDPERTSRAFVANPTNQAWTERMYRTGDLVRLGEDGRRLDFVGRRDNQIKHMGYRIELEEIEAALNQLEGVAQSAVLQRTERRDIKLLVAYLATEVQLSDQDLRERLGKLLPPYMIPQRFELRATLPKNANGKVDRLALAAEA